MTPIEIRYRPISFIPWTRSLQREHPNAWHELTPAQFIAVACVYRGSISDDRLVSSMLKIPYRIARKMVAYHKMKIVEMIEFIKEPAPHYEFIVKDLLVQLNLYRAPQPKLKDETFGAFIFAEHYFSRYNEKSDPADLDRFIACWYRHEKFNEKDIEVRAKVISKASLVKKEAIFINYQLIREYLVLAYPNVFKVESETQKTTEKNTWVDVFDALVNDDLKDQDKYAELPLSAVLRYLDNRIKKQREDESKIR